jgi:CRP-like cAMP-binding protein
MKIESYQSRATLLAPGHVNDDLFVVEDGEVEVQRSLRGRPPPRLLVLGRGSFIGALELPPDKQLALVPTLVSSGATGEGCTVLRVRRAEIGWRGGKLMLLNLAIQEAESWLNRLTSPGLYRAAHKTPATHRPRRSFPSAAAMEEKHAQLAEWLVLRLHELEEEKERVIARRRMPPGGTCY